MEDIIFVSAQPDVPYFHWQIKLYTHNFIEKGINPCQIHVIFGLTNGQTEPSKGALELCDYGFNVHFYIDDRISKNNILNMVKLFSYMMRILFLEYYPILIN